MTRAQLADACSQETCSKEAIKLLSECQDYSYSYAPEPLLSESTAVIDDDEWCYDDDNTFEDGEGCVDLISEFLTEDEDCKTACELRK